MSKKIKYIVAIFIITLCSILFFNVNVADAVINFSGYNSNYFNGGNRNKWSSNMPSSLYPIYTIIDDTANSGFLYFCREKGGGLRLYTKPDSYNGTPVIYGKPIDLVGDGTTGVTIEGTKYTTYNSAVTNLETNLSTVEDKIIEVIGTLQGNYKAFITGEGYDNGFTENATEVLAYTELKNGAGTTINSSDIGQGYYLNNAGTDISGTITGVKLATKPTYSVAENGDNKEVTNTVASYIMSAGKNWREIQDFGKGNYQTTESDTTDIYDQQEALWLHKDTYGEIYNIGDTYSTTNTALYEEAIAYKAFIDTVQQYGYNPTITLQSSTPTIIVNKNDGTFTVGPYVANYLNTNASYNNRFSYIEDMYIIDQNGNRIENVTIIKSNGSGLEQYPSHGETFFVKFSSATNPTNITVGADFAYLKTTYAKYNELTGSGNIVNWIGTMNIACNSGEFANQTEETLAMDGVYSGSEMISKGYKLLNGNDPVSNLNYRITTGYWTDIHYEIALKNNGTYQAQAAAEVIATTRTWERVPRKATTSVKISMQVGGKVFVDVASGKETAVDGIYKSNVDKAMPGVTVHLFSKNSGKEIASTITDTNGQYVFKGLNVLDQYYVRFDYNGQYYEPTYYTTPSNTGDYKNTSNGTDYAETRVKLNLRFASIGSSPENYDTRVGYDNQYERDQIINSNYNKTFSKMQLLGYELNSEGKYVKTREAIIDSYCSKCNNNQSHTTTEDCYKTFGNLTPKYRNANVQTLSELEKQMVQYVKDCKIYSWTKNNGTNLNNNTDDSLNYYPLSNILVLTNNGANVDVDTTTGNVSTLNGINTAIKIDEKSQYINQGYKERQEADVALREDVYTAKIEINGKYEDYIYRQREGKTTEAEEKGWEIGARIQDGYYGTLYSREIYPSDYQFKVSDYGKEFSGKYNKTIEDELNIYVTYELKVMNRSMSIRTRIDEIVHYYDSDYEYIPNRSYILLPNGTKIENNSMKASNTSKYSSNTTTNLNGYQTMYIAGLDGTYLDAGQTAKIYLTFRIKKDTINNQQWLKLDENAETAQAIGLGKESISEINGYSTLYKAGTEIPNIGKVGTNEVAGIVDVDSNPGNLNPNDVPKDGKIKYENFEDDTDKAPNLRVILYRGKDNARIITGYVWEDERNLINNSQATATGNGIRDDKETLINGVTVELVELMDNGTEHIWRTYEYGTGTANETKPIINVGKVVENYKFEGKTSGTYAFKSFVPGNYIVRFKYGDTVKTVLGNNSEATNALIGKYGLSDNLKKLLNDVSYNGQDYKSTLYQTGLRTYNGKNTSKQYNYDIAKGDTALVSDAKDLYNIRLQVIDYSDGEIRNKFGELLASYTSILVHNNPNADKNIIKAYLDEFMKYTAMTAETGIINMQVEYNTTTTANNSNNNKTTYHLANLDLGLEERPKAQIEINKDVKNLKITLADGTVLFDATASADNLLWQPNPFSGAYENNLMYIRTPREYGLVQPTMDQELMHGATVRITYEITAKNIGEADYKEEQFYYTGKVGNKNTIVTTNAIQLVDYIPNNIQYYEVDNKDYWTVITAKELVDKGLVNAVFKEKLEKFNTIVTTTKTNTALYPAIYTEKVAKNKANSVSVPIVLTQLITAENKTADLTYNNMVELVAHSNTVGRKMAYSVPGSQDPTQSKPGEIDADVSTVRILPPFGVILTYVIIAVITIAGAAIIAGGIIFIKKKVLTK